MNHCLFLILMHLFISMHVHRPCKAHMTACSKNDNKKQNFLRRQAVLKELTQGSTVLILPKYPQSHGQNKTKKGKPQKRM